LLRSFFLRFHCLFVYLFFPYLSFISLSLHSLFLLFVISVLPPFKFMEPLCCSKLSRGNEL
jgi:hypothetical protein